MLHSEIEFQGESGPIKVRIEPAETKDGEESASLMVTTKDGVVVLDAAEFEHIHKLLQAYYAAQEAAVRALSA